MTFVVLILAALLFIPTPGVAATQCTCPTIAASGAGNTSCSASERENKCTVDFNVFFEREERAIQLLGSAGVTISSRPDPTANILQALGQVQGRPEQLADTILLYLMVALSAQPNAAENSGFIRDVRDAVRSSAPRLARAFDVSLRLRTNDDLRQSPPDNVSFESFSSGLRGRIVEGCIELAMDRTWVMFKANWSPYRLMPRCGQ
jgi:hypothetical protein